MNKFLLFERQKVFQVISEPYCEKRLTSFMLRMRWRVNTSHTLLVQI